MAYETLQVNYVFSYVLYSYIYKLYFSTIPYLISRQKSFKIQKSEQSHQNFFAVPEPKLLQETLLILTNWMNRTLLT